MNFDFNKLLVVLCSVVILVGITAFYGKSIEISPTRGLKFESAP
ncbi:hypothetical protein [Ensifer adhaerens]|nr:hypothetical protein [Ensifer adhaerens]